MSGCNPSRVPMCLPSVLSAVCPPGLSRRCDTQSPAPTAAGLAPKTIEKKAAYEGTQQLSTGKPCGISSAPSLPFLGQSLKCLWRLPCFADILHTALGAARLAELSALTETFCAVQHGSQEPLLAAEHLKRGPCGRETEF